MPILACKHVPSSTGGRIIHAAKIGVFVHLAEFELGSWVVEVGGALDRFACEVLLSQESVGGWRGWRDDKIGWDVGL